MRKETTTITYKYDFCFAEVPESKRNKYWISIIIFTGEDIDENEKLYRASGRKDMCNACSIKLCGFPERRSNG